MTPSQTQLLQIAKRQTLQNDDRRYRMLLQNVAGVSTSSKLTNAQFEDVMSTLEDMGFRHTGKGETYWRDKVQNRAAGKLGTLILGKIHALIKGQPYPLGAMVHRISNRRTDNVNQLDYHEAYALVEALKGIHRRQERENQQGKLFTADHTDDADQQEIHPCNPRNPRSTLPVPAQGGAPDDDEYYQSCQDLPF